MRFADPTLLSARAESPDGAPPNPQVRTATAARLNKCRAIGIAPTLKPGGAERKGAPQAQISDYSQNSSILRLIYPVVIALTAGNEARISPPDFARTLDFLACRSASPRFLARLETRNWYDGPSLRADRQSGAHRQ